MNESYVNIYEELAELKHIERKDFWENDYKNRSCIRDQILAEYLELDKQ